MIDMLTLLGHVAAKLDRQAAGIANAAQRSDQGSAYRQEMDQAAAVRRQATAVRAAMAEIKDCRGGEE